MEQEKDGLPKEGKNRLPLPPIFEGFLLLLVSGSVTAVHTQHPHSWKEIPREDWETLGKIRGITQCSGFFVAVSFRKDETPYKSFHLDDNGNLNAQLI